MRLCNKPVLLIEALHADFNNQLMIMFRASFMAKKLTYASETRNIFLLQYI